MKEPMVGYDKKKIRLMAKKIAPFFDGKSSEEARCIIVELRDILDANTKIKIRK